MNYQRPLKILLLVLALASIAYVLVGDQWPRAATESTDAPLSPNARLVVYYFDQGKDCATCEQIPAYTEVVLERHFAKELQEGVIVWRSVDADQPGNEHYLTKYSLYTKSIVLVSLQNGEPRHWKNLDQVWDLIYDRPAFEKYLKESIDAALHGDAA